MADGAHVIFKTYSLDRAPIKNLLMLVTLPGKLGDEGRHCKKAARRKRVFWVGGFEDEDLEKEMRWRIRARVFRKFWERKVRMRDFQYL